MAWSSLHCGKGDTLRLCCTKGCMSCSGFQGMPVEVVLCEGMCGMSQVALWCIGCHKLCCVEGFLGFSVVQGMPCCMEGCVGCSGSRWGAWGGNVAVLCRVSYVVLGVLGAYVAVLHGGMWGALEAMLHNYVCGVRCAEVL